VWLAVGLKNPGSEYAGTRHNVGAEAVACVARREGGTFKRERGMTAEVTEVGPIGRRLALALPDTYMNESGVAVRPLVDRYVGGDPARLIIVHDELDLPPGAVRIKVAGGTAGHNGLRSISHHLASLEFVRIRIGIGKPPGRSDGAGHVLSRPGKAERVELDIAVEVAADALLAIYATGVDDAMNRFNSR